ncbi:sialidase family protein [Neorhizobium sp. T6_25]|uniref:sialidase family protein n=1 Tax=Neorhizobium sp. T6_25 TaxID=2093833 RepID=UPI00155F5035
MPVVKSDAIKNVEVYRKPGEFAAWPANYGLWLWGDEAVTIFVQGFRGEAENLHARDKTRPFIPVQARSLDGGETWTIERFNAFVPGSQTLSGDEHVLPELEAQPRIDIDRDLRQLDQPIDFTDPETIVMCARTGLLGGAISWFYVSNDRARTWRGPYRLGDFGLPGISARTDIVPLGKHDALFLLSAAKPNGKEGQVFCVRTRDGGKSFSFESFVGEEPEGFAIMPASIRLKDGKVLTLVRCSTASRGPDRKAWIEAYTSGDEGRTWELIGRPVPNTGYAGNPPTLNRLKDDRLVLVFGYRDAPYGLRARVSSDEGKTWSDDIVIRDDGGMSDLGYPRTVVRPDGKLLSVYYYNYGSDQERFIGASIFDVAG